MLHKYFSSSSIVAAALATVACVGLAGAASAGIIYQDSFSGTNTTPLNGAAPTVDNGTSLTWTAGSAWADSGYTNTATGRWNASLAFTPVNGQIYTLSAGLDMTGPGSSPNGNDWLAIGFMNTQNTNTAFDANYQNSSQPAAADPWVQSALGGAGGTVFTGPGTAGNQGFANAVGVNTYSIVLNTGSSAWAYNVYLTNSNVTNKLVGTGAVETTPGITAVGLENGLGVGEVSNFSLTDVAVPEPASLGLLTAGGLGLLLLKRRKAV